MTETPTFYHAPNTRSTGVRVLLEELGAPYEMHALNRHKGENQAEAYRAVNPAGKVPAIRHRGAVVTEQVAIYIYLADAFPAAGLAPALDDALRGPYLRWIAYYGSAWEPAMVDRALRREPGQHAMSPYGTYDTVVDALAEQLRAGPWLLGERFTAADVLWGTALGWMLRFKLVPDRAEFTAHAARLAARPAAQRAYAADAALAAQHEAEAGKAGAKPA